MTRKIRLGVNIDHIATVRNARGGLNPDPLEGALIAEKSGADGITIHLREDRRHIRDADVTRIKSGINLPLNLELAATDEMQRIAKQVLPHACCIVPEKREEITTEGGLDVIGNQQYLAKMIANLHESKIKVSLFVDPDLAQIEAAANIKADIIEIHTGKYCHTEGAGRQKELQKIQAAAKRAGELGLECHAGHGLDYNTVPDIAKIPNIVELNIGHFIIGQSIFYGLDFAIKKMKETIKESL
jgi:pyridoxine 5-phosphate synthase